MAWLLVVGLGCDGLAPNTAPRLAAFNGLGARDAVRGVPMPELMVTDGEDYPIVVEATDAQGDEMRIWIPAAPPGLELDEETGEGRWEDPRYLDLDVGFLEVVLEDLHPREPRWRTERVWLFPAVEP